MKFHEKYSVFSHKTNPKLALNNFLYSKMTELKRFAFVFQAAIGHRGHMASDDDRRPGHPRHHEIVSELAPEEVSQTSMKAHFLFVENSKTYCFVRIIDTFSNTVFFYILFYQDIVQFDSY